MRRGSTREGNPPAASAAHPEAAPAASDATRALRAAAWRRGRAGARAATRCASLLGERFQVGEAGLEVLADHLVHVEEQAHQLRDERARTVHGPGDLGRLAARLEKEVGAVVALEGLLEIELDRDFRGRGFEDLHAALPRLGVAFPFVYGALAGGRA